MGKPFREEVANLAQTHAWACSEPVEPVSIAIARLLSKPIVAVGSGGSFTTATFAASLFRRWSTQVAFATTPLSMHSMRDALRNSSVLIATAGGSNPDVIGALQTAALCDSSEIVAICAKAGTKLAAEGSKFSNVSVHEFAVPSGGDGFLATNSLWASVVLLYRAFGLAFGTKKLTDNLPQLVGARKWDAFVSSIAGESEKLWNRNTVVVLHGPSSQAAAIDLESKLVEAALSDVWIADYRHFAHGRHHWLAKRGSSSSIIAFIEPTEAALAAKTLAALPKDIPQLQIQLPDTPAAILVALAHVFPITLGAGLARGIDPGRPGVPAFGRQIYHLNAYGKAFGKMASEITSIDRNEIAAIQRKSKSSIKQLTHKKRLNAYRIAYAKSLQSLQKIRLRGIVFDYDGTLCSASERFSGIRKSVSSELSRLLAAGIRVGIATGRGRSVRVALQECIPREFWDRVLVGYYNASQISTLNDDDTPDGRPGVIDELKSVYQCLIDSKRLRSIAKIEGRLRQITITAQEYSDAEECWQVANHIVHENSPSGLHFVRSSHSLDVLPIDVSKIAVLRKLELLDGDFQILAVGDMGNWPGNDFQLLSHRYSLSVDQVSPDLSTCWNIASPGIRGVEATLEYLSHLRISSGGYAKLDMRRLSKRAAN